MLAGLDPQTRQVKLRHARQQVLAMRRDVLVSATPPSLIATRQRAQSRVVAPSPYAVAPVVLHRYEAKPMTTATMAASSSS